MSTKHEQKHNWHNDVFFGIHYDLHANEKDTELGRELTHEHLRERLNRVKPDWIQCDCKGHPGYTSWPTETGSASPGIMKDALRIHRDVTRELGIPLGMHYSGVIDNKAIELHPDWSVIDAKGQGGSGSTCRHSAYADALMIPQMLELIDKYDIDGFWVDGENWGAQPCWCDRCKSEFTRRTGIEEAPLASEQPCWREWLDFHRDLFRDYVTHYADAVHARKPDCLICSNWMYTVRQPEAVTVPVDYLSGDYTPNWGAARAALEGRMLDNRRITWDLMVWGFTRSASLWESSPWAMKPVVHLQQEVSEVVALGGAVMVYVQPQRTGWLTGWQHDIIGEVADFCRARKNVSFRSQSASEAAILHLSDHYYTRNASLFNYGTAIQPLEGALNALLETHRSADILTEDNIPARLDSYKLLVLPEQTHLSDALVGALTAWIKKGGKLLASGSRLTHEIPELTGCSAKGESMNRTVMLPVDGEAVTMAGEWQTVQLESDTEAVLCGVRNLEPTMPDEEDVLVTLHHVGKGAVLAVHGPLFLNYFTAHFPRIRKLIAKFVETLSVDWTVTLDGPPQIEMIQRRKNGCDYIHLINRGAGETLSPERVFVSELPPVSGVKLTVTCETAPADVELLPDHTALRWEYAHGILTIHVPEIRIHDIVAIKPRTN